MLNKDLSKISSQIIKLLKANKDGLTIKKISQKLGIYRSTASKYLLILERDGVVNSKKVGPAKIYFISDRRKKSVHRNVHQSIEEDISWVDSLILEIKEELKEEILREGLR